MYRQPFQFLVGATGHAPVRAEAQISFVLRQADSGRFPRVYLTRNFINLNIRFNQS